MWKKIRDFTVISGAILTLFAWAFFQPLILITGVLMPILSLLATMRIEAEREKKWERERKKLEDDITAVASYAYSQT